MNCSGKLPSCPLYYTAKQNQVGCTAFLTERCSNRKLGWSPAYPQKHLRESLYFSKSKMPMNGFLPLPHTMLGKQGKEKSHAQWFTGPYEKTLHCAHSQPTLQCWHEGEPASLLVGTTSFDVACEGIGCNFHYQSHLVRSLYFSRTQSCNTKLNITVTICNLVWYHLVLTFSVQHFN